MFHFANPYYFLLLLLAGVGAWFVYRRRISRGLLFAPVARIPSSGRFWRANAALLLSTLYLAGIVLAIIALSRPQTVLSQSRRKADVISLFMVLDVSGSMEALDMSDIVGNQIVKERTRLDAVKQTFAEFVGKRPDDLIGLVTFGGFAATRAPLTLDHEALLLLLKAVQVPKPTQDGRGQIVNQEETLTAIGDALATACARMEKAGTKSKVIVLLSDGVSNTGIIKPEEALKMAKKLGFKVYTVGVGSSGAAPFKGRDAFGREGVFMAQVEMDEALLQRIASETGGQYFNVRNNRGLEKAMESINKLEKTAVEKDVYNQYNELFLWFLAPALALIAVATGLNMAVARRIA
jgi:Ca-activated chloride channel family protein